MRSRIREAITDYGRLHLYHDNTPGKFDPYTNQSDKDNFYNDARYRGYPKGRMEVPREPLTIQPGEFKCRDPPKYDFRRRGVLDVDRPVIDENHSGVMYGSGTYQPPGTGPRPFRNPSPFGRRNMDDRKVSQLRQETEYNVHKTLEDDKLRKLGELLEQRKELHSLNNDAPWGKPGGGAPAGEDIRRHKFPDETQYNASWDDSTDTSFLFHRPGAGAPLRSETGGVVAKLRNNESIRYRKPHTVGREYIDPFRYRVDRDAAQEYSRELGKIAHERALEEESERQIELKAEADMILNNPFGRHRQASYIRKEDRSYPQPIKLDSTIQDSRSWGQGYGTPRVSSDGNVLGHEVHDRVHGNVLFPRVDRHDNGNRYQEGTLHLATGSGGGEPIRRDVDSSSEMITQVPSKFHADVQGEKVVPDNISDYDNGAQPKPSYPFGSPGGGSPLYTSDGQLWTTVPGKSTLEKSMVEEERKRQAAAAYRVDIVRRHHHSNGSSTAGLIP